MNFAQGLSRNFVSFQQNKILQKKEEETVKVEDSSNETEKMNSVQCNDRNISAKDMLEFMEYNAIQNLISISTDGDSSTNSTTYTYDELKSKGYSDDVINLCFDKNGDNYTLKDEYDIDFNNINSDTLYTMVFNSAKEYAQQAKIPNQTLPDLIKNTINNILQDTNNKENITFADVINQVFNDIRDAAHGEEVSLNEIKEQGFTQEAADVCFKNVGDGKYVMCQIVRTTISECQMRFQISGDNLFDNIIYFMTNQLAPWLTEHGLQVYDENGEKDIDATNSLIERFVKDTLYKALQAQRVSGEDTNLAQIINNIFLTDDFSSFVNQSPVVNGSYSLAELNVLGYPTAMFNNFNDVYKPKSEACTYLMSEVRGNSTKGLELMEAVENALKQANSGKGYSDKDISDAVNEALGQLLGDYTRNNNDHNALEVYSLALEILPERAKLNKPQYNGLTKQICFELTDNEKSQDNLKIKEYYDHSLSYLLTSSLAGPIIDAFNIEELQNSLFVLVKNRMTTNLDSDEKIQEFINKYLSKIIGDFQNNNITNMKLVDLVYQLTEMSPEEIDEIYNSTAIPDDGKITAAQLQLLGYAHLGSSLVYPSLPASCTNTGSDTHSYNLHGYQIKISDTLETVPKVYGNCLQTIIDDIKNIKISGMHYSDNDISIAVNNALVHYRSEYKNTGHDATWLDVYKLALEYLKQHESSGEWTPWYVYPENDEK